MSAPFKRRHILPGFAWQDGGTPTVLINGLPPLGRIEAFVFTFAATFVTGGAAAAIAGRELYRLISKIVIGDNVNVTGPWCFYEFWQMHGRSPRLPANLPAANAQTHRRTVRWVLSFLDPRAKNPHDDCPIGADFNGQQIGLNLASYLGLDNGGDWNTLDAAPTGNVRIEAILAPPNRKPSSIVKLGVKDLTGQTPDLGAGMLVDAFVYRENMDTVSSAQIISAAMQMDAKAVHDVIQFHELTGRFNDLFAPGHEAITDHATAPVGGEALAEEPGFANGDPATVTATHLPLQYPPVKGYKKSHLPTAQTSTAFAFEGSDVTFHTGYRIVLPYSPDAGVAAFRRRGIVVSPSEIEAAGESKKGVTNAEIAPYLPLRRRAGKQ